MKRILPFVTGLSYCYLSTAFGPTFTSETTRTASRQQSFRLRYRNNNNNDESRDGARRIRQRGLTIPLIGPIPNQGPLLLGSELLLDPPTPLQWLALEESVTLYELSLSDENVTAIDAAPIVAIIDDVSAKNQDVANQNEGRYATVAAVVGISSSTTSNKNHIDTSDETSFMESIMDLSADGSKIKPMSSRIRLIGIGRALLSDFFQQLPTTSSHSSSTEEEAVPIVMAEFQMLYDSSENVHATNENLGSKGAPSRFMSPVHALAKANSVSHRVDFLHESRKRLVNGLHAAKARLHYIQEENEELIDHDGLGLLFGYNDADEFEMENDKMTLDEFLAQFKSALDDGEMVDECTVSDTRCATLDNFGLGYGPAFSTLNDLTRVALQSLKPYYSRDMRDTEEYELYVKSFVAFACLEGYCLPQDAAWALQCTNGVDRLNRAYNIMYRHMMELEELAKEFACRLRDCGDECTYF